MYFLDVVFRTEHKTLTSVINFCLTSSPFLTVFVNETVENTWKYYY